MTTPLSKGIRIESNGTRQGTFVSDIATGERLVNVLGVSFDLKPGHMRGVACLTLAGPIVYEGPAKARTPEMASDD